MDNLILKDQTTIEVEEGYTPARLVTYVDTYADLQGLAGKLTQDNLSTVKRVSQATEEVLETYNNMAAMAPLFKVEPTGERLQVIFGLRQLTGEELRAPAVDQAIEYLTDEQALTVKTLYPTWEVLIGQTVDPGARFTYGDALYKVITPDPLLIQSQWIPGQGTSAIYSQISAGQAGTLEDPIDVPEDVTSNAFTYVTGKYYRWNGQIYKCERQGEPAGTEHSFVYSPDQLIGQYFVVAEE